MTMTSEPVFAPARLALLLQHFAEINDDRESWRVAYPLKEVRLLVTCATIASCDDFEAIVSWGEHPGLPASIQRLPSRRPVRPLAARSDEPDRSGPLRPLF